MKLFAVIGGSAAVTAAAIGVAVLQGPASTGSMAGDMETGVTMTQTSTAPTQLSVAPQITGPAALPPEEQGLPG
ncbi:hypothetical protein H7K45_27540 [Mycobacterium yunnanensis]|uniref:Uncharacterized protein n=1 Tax=Mycobacterium yunnanensis TaxID=368477 RepID=A0A9X2ZB90_9MYCO|nr:hypothetical protein [Mycobacterium yunnanensis]MCV7424307.1 hypothetical protein [Mycobacterium yunnanensis]